MGGFLRVRGAQVDMGDGVVHGLLTEHKPLSLPVLGSSVFWHETASLVGVENSVSKLPRGWVFLEEKRSKLARPREEAVLSSLVLGGP